MNDHSSSDIVTALEDALEYVEADLRERFSVSGQNVRDEIRSALVAARSSAGIDTPRYLVDGLPELPDDDADFTPYLARKIIAKYQKLLRDVAQPPAKSVGFMQAMDIVEAGFNNWKGKAHNQKWFRRIDGTPIPNDLMVNIAEAISRASLVPSTEGK